MDLVGAPLRHSEWRVTKIREPWEISPVDTPVCNVLGACG